MDGSLLSDQLARQDWIEWVGWITGILYVLYAAYEKPVCWIFGIISCAAIAWKSFTDYHLVADGILQVFYVGMGFVGLSQWMKGSDGQHPRPVITSPLRIHVMVISICLLLSIPLSAWLIHHAGARYGYPDTVLTLLSVFATYLLVRKDLHTWWYWIVIDVVYTGLYAVSEGYLFAVLYLLYAVMSIVGYTRWNHARVNPAT